MKFIALKTCDGGAKGRISFCCKALKVTRQGFHDYLKNRNKPWKHEELAAKMMEILHEDECNDTYGRERMHKALLLKYPDSGIPSEATVYRVMTAIGITHRPNRKPNGITKADREARKSDDLLKRGFKADKPFSKCVTDITEVKAKETLNKTKSTRSNERTHGSDFVTLRFIQRIPAHQARQRSLHTLR